MLKMDKIRIKHIQMPMVGSIIKSFHFAMLTFSHQKKKIDITIDDHCWHLDSIRKVHSFFFHLEDQSLEETCYYT